MSFFVRNLDTGREIDSFALPAAEAQALSNNNKLSCTYCFNQMSYRRAHLRMGAMQSVRAHFAARAATGHVEGCVIEAEAAERAKNRATLLKALKEQRLIVFNLNIPTGYFNRSHQLRSLPHPNELGYEVFKKQNPQAALVPVPSMHDLLVECERVHLWQTEQGKLPNSDFIYVHNDGVVQKLADFVVDDPEKLTTLVRTLYQAPHGNCVTPKLVVFTPATTALERVATGKAHAKPFCSTPNPLNYNDPLGARLMVSLRHQQPAGMDHRSIKPVEMARVGLSTSKIAVLAYPVLWGENKGLGHDRAARFLTLNVFDERQMACLANTDVLNSLHNLVSPAKDFMALLKGGETKSKNVKLHGPKRRRLPPPPKAKVA